MNGWCKDCKELFEPYDMYHELHNTIECELVNLRKVPVVCKCGMKIGNMAGYSMHWKKYEKIGKGSEHKKPKIMFPSGTVLLDSGDFVIPSIKGSVGIEISQVYP